MYCCEPLKLQYVDLTKVLRDGPVCLVLLSSAEDIAQTSTEALAYFSRVYTLPTVQSYPLNMMPASEMLHCIELDRLEHCQSSCAVFSFDDFYIESALDIAQVLGCNFMTGTDPLVFRNKLVMKRHMDAHDIRVPRAYPVNIDTDPQVLFSAAAEKLGLPFIMKPVDGAGSFDVTKIDDLPTLRKALKHAKRSNFTYEVEEFISGTLYHCDIAIADGLVTYAACGQYLHPVMEAKPNKIVGSVMLPDLCEKAQQLLSFARTCLNTLDIRYGMLHIEIFELRTTGELCFLEMGFRPPGLPSMNRMADQTLYTYMLSLLSHRRAPDHQLVPEDLAVGGGVCPPAISGRIEEIQPFNHPSLCSVTFHKKPGDRVDLSSPVFVRLFDFQTYPGPVADIWDLMMNIERRDYIKMVVE